MNYFELFALPVNFAIDKQSLSERYRELQRTVHPDTFSAGSEQDKRIALQRTAQVNDAYQTLRHPVSRAEHMLLLKGQDIQHETTTVKDMAFLMQQMTWREALAEIPSAQVPEDNIAELADEFTRYQGEIIGQLAIKLASSQPQDLTIAVDLVRKLKFMNKLQDELSRAEDALFD
ncbi:co-chaperone HscB [Shewanella sp. NIFS-20-20]|uniref:co-chaperone HscB n=1 Tax=Shewanella sp. NIFS-20-20 TaxID=2853806 RepID=UPI001C488166|nr:co-chaperone HscB [Shewanella sp. NIFS-20-20]MBV7315159.1 co-chaperone HscB [Shewanella sp. NIFS-20-20]